MAAPPPSSAAWAGRRRHRPAGRTAARLMRPSAASSHRTTESSRNSSASTTSAKPRSRSAAYSLRRVHSCISSTRYRRCAWTTSWTSTPGSLQGDQDLDHQLVARRRRQVGRGPQPRGQLLLALRRDPEPLLRAVLVGVVGLDQCRPARAAAAWCTPARRSAATPRRCGPRTPGAAAARTWALAQQGQQGVPDAHIATRPSPIKLRCIPSMLHSRRTEGKGVGELATGGPPTPW